MTDFELFEPKTWLELQEYLFTRLLKILDAHLKFADKNAARGWFHTVTRLTRDWNRLEMETPEFMSIEQEIEQMLVEVADYA